MRRCSAGPPRTGRIRTPGGTADTNPGRHGGDAAAGGHQIQFGQPVAGGVGDPGLLVQARPHAHHPLVAARAGDPVLAAQVGDVDEVGACQHMRVGHGHADRRLARRRQERPSRGLARLRQYPVEDRPGSRRLPGMINTPTSALWWDVSTAATPAQAAVALLDLALAPVNPQHYGELVRYGEVLPWSPYAHARAHALYSRDNTSPTSRAIGKPTSGRPDGQVAYQATPRRRSSTTAAYATASRTPSTSAPRRQWPSPRQARRTPPRSKDCRTSRGRRTTARPRTRPRPTPAANHYPGRTNGDQAVVLAGTTRMTQL